MTTRAHRMPFGATPTRDGRVRFRVWAPGAADVKLCIEDAPEAIELTMAPESEGWFGVVTRWAARGSRYRFRIDGGTPLPDPASRFQPADVHGPSEVIDPREYDWGVAASDGRPWRGRPWHEAVIYELHVGTFTQAGTFAAAAERLDHVADLGATAIELMPLADFAGTRNWGYDGVLPFAPDAQYGRPEDLKALVEAAHRRDLMVLLDVVYNHLGPEGNYLPQVAPAFFSGRHRTPWGPAINYDGPDSAPVRAFVLHNALYWLEEYDLDGLRLDAVDTIVDESRPDIVADIADRVRRVMPAERQVHLVLENDRNESVYLEQDSAGSRRPYDAQWNDDAHHAAHVLATGEEDGYYADYADAPVRWLGRCLASGFGYQGERSRWRGGRRRGRESGHLPATAFVQFLQNHDQIGNRPHGDRLVTLAPVDRIRALTAIFLLAPQPPLLFMGQEWGTRRPFLFFCDFEPELAERVATGRREEFSGFQGFQDPAARARIPDPAGEETFRRSTLDWQEPANAPHAGWLAFHRELLALRHSEVIPRLADMTGHAGRFETFGATGVAVDWRLGDDSRLQLHANLGEHPVERAREPAGRLLYTTVEPVPADTGSPLPPWSVHWYLQTNDAGGTPT